MKIVPDDQFVRTWMLTRDHVVMSEILNMRIGSVKARVARLRQAGVNLPHSARRRQYGPDVAALNAIVEESERL